jgi:anthranilate phosphoribosyltransferase
MPIEPKEILNRLLEGENLTEAEAAELMCLLTDESLPAAVTAGILVALRAKGETADEVRGFARSMRSLAVKPEVPEGIAAADSVGTGGDGSGSLNLSTGTALLAAACGIPMIKHGNRSVSSKSGSADVLAALGVPQPEDAVVAMECLKECNFTFLFAPYFHPAMKAIAPVRSALGVRTVFNILGPLANPAEPPFHLVGAFDVETARLMADTLAGMPIERAFVVHGEPGWDEATPAGSFIRFDVRPGQVEEEWRNPSDYGLPTCNPEDLAGGDASVNAAALEAVLNGSDTGAHRDALALGAGLLLELTGREPSLETGIQRASTVLASGECMRVLECLRNFSGNSHG